MVSSALLAATLLQAPPAGAPAPDARAIVLQAVQAAGGEEALRAHPALAWRGKATVQSDRSKVALTGYWRLVPPDRAVVETQLADGGPATLRRLVVNGERGWNEQQGKSEPLPYGALANEREQFALYSVVRLLPLLGDDYRLVVLEGRAEGGPALRVSHAGRHDVEVYFDAALRPVRLRTQIVNPENATLIDEQIVLSGTMESQGVRWFKTLGITWDGKPFFEVTLTEFEALPNLPDDLFRPGK